MKEFTVTAEKKSETGKNYSRQLRRTGRIPGILYGGTLPPQPLVFQPDSILVVLRSETGVNSLFKLQISGENVPVNVMIKDYQVDPISHKAIHIDLIRIAMDKKLHVRVPIEIVGTPKGVKEGGLLDFMHREMRIHCLPSAIPDHIRVDVSELKIGATLRVSDIAVPEGIEKMEDPETVVAVVSVPKVEKVEVPAAAPEEEAEKVEPEVLKKGKAASEGKEEEKAESKEKEEK